MEERLSWLEKRVVVVERVVEIGGDRRYVLGQARIVRSDIPLMHHMAFAECTSA